ncbi:MAG: hypothetical protein KAV87_19500 [Desulfobacteraceae bacterium]|nr:hypothetical protein [Desulfobacteraceae bacterium]
MNRDNRYMHKAKRAATLSTCDKKSLGAVLVPLKPNKSCIIGWNGPPTPLKRCGICRRQAKDWDGHKDCRAVHAERMTLLRAAHMGISTYDATLYAYMGIPCKDCLLELIAAGIKRIVVKQLEYYDELSKEIIKEWLANGGKLDVL